MKKEELIEALKMLGRGRIDAAETIADLLMPEPKTFTVDVPEPKTIVVEVPEPKKKSK